MEESQKFCYIIEDLIDKALGYDRVEYRLIPDENFYQLTIVYYSDNRVEDEEVIFIPLDEIQCYNKMIYVLLDKVEDLIIDQLRELIKEQFKEYDILDITISGHGRDDYRRAIILVKQGKDLYEVKFEFYISHKYKSKSEDLGFTDEVFISVEKNKEQLHITKL